MTFIKALDELKHGKLIYNTCYPKICYRYTPNEIVYKFRKGSFNRWYYDEEDDAISFQEVLFDDWDILNADDLIFVY